MKRIVLWIALALATAAQAALPGAGTATPAELKPEQREAKAAHWAAEVLSRFHYKATPLDEALSAKVFDQYLKALDSERLLFLQEDIDRLAAWRTRLGEDEGE